MKTALWWTAVILLLGTLMAFCTASAKADGLTTVYDDPEVMEPVQGLWQGPYVGLSYGRVSKTTETHQCFKLGQPKACDDPIFIYYPEYKEVVTTQTESTDDRAGLLLGYRWDMGKLVAGAELDIYEDATLPGIQLGWDAGNLLPYAHYDKDGAAVGIEARISPKLRAGIRAGEDGGMLTISMGF